MDKIRVTVWNEFRHEKIKEKVWVLYPNGLHATIKEFLDTDEELEVRLAALDDEECGLPDEVLDNTDVLIWWGHAHHDLVPDELVEKIKDRVYRGGMGFIALHSAHHSKPFKAIVGTNGNLSWGRNQREVIWNLLPAHPITKGIPDHFTIDCEELYCEPFYIPQPDELIFNAWYEDGYVFRAGACFYRGAGKVFYFQPGHESCRSFYNIYVRRIINNAVHWAAPNDITYEIPNGCPKLESCAYETKAEYLEGSPEMLVIK